MNNSIVTSATPQLNSTTVYKTLQLTGEEAVSLGSVSKSPASWRRFIHRSTQQVGFESTVVAIPAARTTTERLTVLKPMASAPTTKELLSSPLFQVAGIFAIGVSGWADKHDEYLAETYLENHADSK